MKPTALSGLLCNFATKINRSIQGSTLAASLLACAFLIAPGIASAQLIVDPVSATSNDTQFGAPDNARNQSGLSAGYTSLVDNFNAYIATGPVHDSSDQSNRWTSNPLPGSIDFDLGASYSIDALALWSQGNGIGSIAAFTLTAADDSAFTNPTSLGSFSGSSAGTAAAAPAQVFTFPATEARFVRLTATQSFGFTGATVGEAAFEEVTPEPAGLALLALATAGLLRRRPRHSA